MGEEKILYPRLLPKAVGLERLPFGGVKIDPAIRHGVQDGSDHALRLIENYGILLKYSFMLQKFDVNLVRSILLEIYVYDGCM